MLLASYVNNGRLYGRNINSFFCLILPLCLWLLRVCILLLVTLFPLTNSCTHISFGQLVLGILLLFFECNSPSDLVQACLDRYTLLFPNWLISKSNKYSSKCLCDILNLPLQRWGLKQWYKHWRITSKASCRCLCLVRECPQHLHLRLLANLIYSTVVDPVVKTNLI